MSINYLFGAIAVIGGIAGYLITRKTTLTFDEYCEECKKHATEDLNSIDGAIRTILVLAKCDDNHIAPYLYSNYAEGKIKKKRVHYRTFSFEECPSSVKDSISKGEYVVCKY